jgi:hypothetical protein
VFDQKERLDTDGSGSVFERGMLVLAAVSSGRKRNVLLEKVIGKNDSVHSKMLVYPNPTKP